MRILTSFFSALVCALTTGIVGIAVSMYLALVAEKAVVTELDVDVEYVWAAACVDADGDGPGGCCFFFSASL